MSTAPETIQAAQARRLELREILNRRYVFIDRKWDIVFLVSAAFVITAAGDLTRLLFAGDWDFWVDWKDRQWWPMVTPFATIIVPSAIQYIAWLAFRLPIGATLTALCLFLAAWIARLYQFDAFVSYPLTLVWPASVVPAALLVDFVLLKTRSFVLTSILGGFVWTFAFWINNYVTLAAYLQPSLFMGHLLTMADVLGIQYLRGQTPEYLRLVESGTLRSFLGETQYVALAFGSTVAVGGYWIGQAVARWIAIWPIGRAIKRL
jgi:methane/ammonia monooxygenase subunit A